jgi:hypothetical protein
MFGLGFFELLIVGAVGGLGLAAAIGTIAFLATRSKR